jgi:ribonuclease T2
MGEDVEVTARIGWAALCIVLVGIGLSQNAAARHRHRAADATPGQFDYYLLSLSWSPAYCLQSPGAAECNGPRRFGFIVHGLWPQNERGWPEHCGGGDVPEDVVNQMSDLMPARGLLYHEWSAHGTCSGQDPAGFFTLVRRAYGSVVLPPAFTHPGAPIQQPPQDITAAFLRSNPRFPSDSIITTCSTQGAARLREVRVCFDRELQPRSCSPDALREACRAASLIVPPVR